MGMATILRRGFSAALAGETFSHDDWLNRVRQYGQDYMALGAIEMQDHLAADLVRLQRQVEAAGLWAVAARLATVYGKTLPSNVGDQGAIGWYHTAAQAADRSEDQDTRVWVRGRAALALAYEGASLDVANQLAGQALELSDRHSLGRLNALTATAHIAAFRGNRNEALRLLGRARREFDAAASDEQISDLAVPEWRFHTFASMLLSRLGDPRAMAEQDAADRTRPASLPRFAKHTELHRGLMMTNSGDRLGGLAYAQAALDRLPPEKHSLSLRLMMAEVERTTAGVRRQ